MPSKRNKWIFLCFLLLSQVWTPHAHAQGGGVSGLKLWPETFFQTILASADELKVRVANSIFDNGLESDLFNDDFGKDVSLGVNMRRDTYNNFDLLNTWTVVDRLRIRLSTQLWGLGDAKDHYAAPPGDSVSFSFAGISFGGNGEIEWRDMKQLSPHDVERLPKVDQEKQRISAAISTFENQGKPQAPLSADAQTQQDLEELNPNLGNLGLDSSLVVKLHDLLNPLTLPFRLPLSRRDLRKMSDGEIISYNLTGRVGFGGRVGWSLVQDTGIQFGADLTAETHWDGEFEVSVMRENERFAKVRMSRIKGHGSSARIAFQTGYKDLFQGIVIFKETKIESRQLETSVSYMPFYFQASKQLNKEIDDSYRYDLETEEGKSAFHAAVLGNMIPSSEIAEREKGVASPTVTKLYSRTATETQKVRTSGTDFDFIFKVRRSLTGDAIETSITTPDGFNKIYKSYYENRKEHHYLLGHDDRIIRRFTINMDEEGFKQSRPGSLLIVAENTVDDSSTNGPELNDYIDDVETIMGQPDLFPSFPSTTPSHPGNRPRRAWYGRSSFYYGFTLKEENLKQLFSADFNAISQEAQNAGLGIEAKDLIKAKKAYESHDPKTTYQSLKNIFGDRKHAHDLMLVLLKFLPLNTYEKFLAAQNKAFGNIQNRGHHVTALETLYESTQAEMGEGSDTHRTVADPEAVVSDISAETLADKKIALHFTLEQEPKFLYFRLTPLTHPHKHKNSAKVRENEELILLNRDHRFVKGENTIVLDPASTDPLIHHLIGAMDSLELFSFTLGYSKKDKNWGYGASTQFTTSHVYDAPYPATNQ